MVCKKVASAFPEIARNYEDLEKEEPVSVDIYEEVLDSVDRTGGQLVSVDNKGEGQASVDMREEEGEVYSDQGKVGGCGLTAVSSQSLSSSL